MSRPSSYPNRGRKNPFKHNQARLNIETLEDRVTPSGNTISGFVFFDANNNGLFDPGETPLANSIIELHNANNQVIGTATTDARGFYQFTKDQTNINQNATLTKTVTFPSTQTNFQLSGVLDQFDPALGQLQSVEIQHAGSITSEIKVENLSTDSPSDISGTVSGTLNLVAPGVNDNLTISGYAGSFHAAPYDHVTDFAGTSGTSFGQKTANGSNTITLTGNDINAYIGTGKVNVTEKGVATSNATGGGNLEVNVASTGQATITVIYHYKTASPLQPGQYTLVQTQEPAGYIHGLNSHQGIVIPNSNTSHVIPVTLTNGDSPDNDFGEVKPTSLSGHVFYDANNNGKFDPTETGIQGVTMTLTGPAGTPMTATTDARGFYHFDALTPGAYTVAETEPPNVLNGIDTAGTKGGTVNNIPGHETISAIPISFGDSAENYDFGELKPASLAGNVYVDAQNHGQLDPGDPPIAGDAITLTGFDDQGPVNQTTATTANGTYSFTSLRPGTYALTQAAPAGYTDGATTVGSQGGSSAPHVISDIHLPTGVDGVNNNFGELRPSTPVTPPLPRDVNLLGMLPIISKTQLTVNPTLANIDPVLRGQMAFAVGATMTLTGQQLDLAGTVNAVGQLSTGTTNAQYVAQLWNSDAHRASQVDSVYQSVLNRAPTAQEQSTAINQLNTGADQLTLMQNLFVSPAYQQLHPTSDALATALSKDILNTIPGTVSMQSLLQSMSAQPLSTVVHDMLNSDASLANLIDNTYRTTVRRPATTAEIQTWMTSLKTGQTTLDALAQRLLSSLEFYQLAFNTIH
jgi:hypothetical protein